MGEKSCFIINSTDQTGNSRHSKIICNEVTTGQIISNVTITSVSIDLDNKISLEWTKYEESDFYQYTLYRSESNEENEENNDSRIILAEIIDPDQTIFEDRNNIGKGKTWYYQIEVHDQFNRISESNIGLGKSKP